MELPGPDTVCIVEHTGTTHIPVRMVFRVRWLEGGGAMIEVEPAALEKLLPDVTYVGDVRPAAGE